MMMEQDTRDHEKGLTLERSKAPLFSETEQNEGEKRVKLQRNCGMDQKNTKKQKTEGMYFKCFSLHRAEFQIICQEEASLGQWDSSESRHYENLSSEKFEKGWGTCPLFIICTTL